MALEGMVPPHKAGHRRANGHYSLYRGVVPPLLGVTPMFAVSFWVG